LVEHYSLRALLFRLDYSTVLWISIRGTGRAASHHQHTDDVRGAWLAQHMSASQLALARCLKAENAGCPADVAQLAYDAAQSLPSMKLLLAGPPCFSVYGARGQCASTAGNPETEPRGRYLNGIRPRTDWKCVPRALPLLLAPLAPVTASPLSRCGREGASTGPSLVTTRWRREDSILGFSSVHHRVPNPTERKVVRERTGVPGSSRDLPLLLAPPAYSQPLPQSASVLSRHR
jgi:hypothetical protein